MAFAKFTSCYMRDEGKIAGSLVILDLYLDLCLFTLPPPCQKKESHKKEKTMELNHLELAAEIMFELCRLHPELCPHRYEWASSIQRKDGSKLEYYKCQICGNMYTTIVHPSIGKGE